jgi:hypothetical protein
MMMLQIVYPDYEIKIRIKGSEVVGMDWAGMFQYEPKGLTTKELQQRLAKYMRQAMKMVKSVK